MDGMATMESTQTHTLTENERRSKNGWVAHRLEWDCNVVFVHNKYYVNIMMCTHRKMRVYASERSSERTGAKRKCRTKRKQNEFMAMSMGPKEFTEI